MSDARLRLLERDALASGDSESWRAYYRERERLGMRLPSGSRSTVVSAPMGCVLTHVQFTKPITRVPPLPSPTPPILDAEVHAVELEWRRCQTPNSGMILVRDPKHAQAWPPLLAALWREALVYFDAPSVNPHMPEPRGLNVEPHRLASASVTFPEFLPDPMIMVRFTAETRGRMWLAAEAARGPVVHEQIRRVRHPNPIFQMPALRGLTAPPTPEERDQRQTGESHRMYRRRLRRGGR